MPASMLFRLTLACCLCMLVGCQTTNGNPFASWSPIARTKGLKDPTRTHLAYAHLQEHSGNLTDARESYEIALKTDAKSVDAVLGLARLDQLAGRDRDAELQYRKALQMAPDNPQVLESFGHFLVTQNQNDEAIRLLERAVQTDPQNRKLRYKLAVALAQSGDIRKAEPHFVEALGDAEADYNIGLIQFEKGQVAEAERRFQRAILRKPSLVQAQQWLDEIRAERGKSAVAGNVPDRVEELAAPAPSSGVGQPAESATASTMIVSPSGYSARMQPDSHTVPSAGNAPATAPLTSAAPTDPFRMSPVQLEQYENSLAPADRERFRQQMRLGQVPPGGASF